VSTKGEDAGKTMLQVQRKVGDKTSHIGISLKTWLFSHIIHLRKGTWYQFNKEPSACIYGEEKLSCPC
jgi:hypothetical protein